MQPVAYATVVCCGCARGNHPHTAAIAEAAPQRSDQRRDKRTRAENQSAPECDASRGLHSEFSNINRQKGHHERVSEIHERAGDRDGDLILAPLRHFIDGCALSRLHSLRSWPLLQYSEEAEYGLREY